MSNSSQSTLICLIVKTVSACQKNVTTPRLLKKLSVYIASNLTSVKLRGILFKNKPFTLVLLNLYLTKVKSIIKIKA